MKLDTAARSADFALTVAEATLLDIPDHSSAASITSANGRVGNAQASSGSGSTNPPSLVRPTRAPYQQALHMPVPCDSRSDSFAAASAFILRHAKWFIRRKQLLGVDPETVMSDVIIGMLRAKTDPDPTTERGRAYLLAATENTIHSHKRSERCAKRGGKIRVVRLSESDADAFVGKRERARRGQSTRPECDSAGLGMDLEALVGLAKPEHQKAILRAYSVGVEEAATEFQIPRRTLVDAIARLKAAGTRMGMQEYLVASPLFAPIAS